KLSFLIDSRIAAPRKINSFKRTRFFLNWLAELFLRNGAVFFYNQRITGLYLIDFFKFYIEGRLDCRSLRGDDYHLIIDIIISRPNTCRVTHDKGIPVPENALNGVATIPRFS